MTHEIAPQYEGHLRTLSGTKEHEELPQAVQDSYWRIKRLVDKIGGHLSDVDLVRIVLDSGMDLPAERPRDFMDEVNEGKARYDCRVEAKWRFGRWVSGAYKGYEAGEIIVVLDDGTAEERRMAPANVRFPAAE